jgi:hypothetical protein
MIRATSRMVIERMLPSSWLGAIRRAGRRMRRFPVAYAKGRPGLRGWEPERSTATVGESAHVRVVGARQRAP